MKTCLSEVLIQRLMRYGLKHPSGLNPASLTIDKALCWFGVVKGLHIDVGYDSATNPHLYWEISNLKGRMLTLTTEDRYSTSEDAYVAAMEYCLDNIIEKEQ